MDIVRRRANVVVEKRLELERRSGRKPGMFDVEIGSELVFGERNDVFKVERVVELRLDGIGRFKSCESDGERLVTITEPSQRCTHLA